MNMCFTWPPRHWWRHHRCFLWRQLGVWRRSHAQTHATFTGLGLLTMEAWHPCSLFRTSLHPSVTFLPSKNSTVFKWSCSFFIGLLAYLPPPLMFKSQEDRDLDLVVAAYLRPRITSGTWLIPDKRSANHWPEEPWTSYSSALGLGFYLRIMELP